jgi:hypothetical protein
MHGQILGKIDLRIASVAFGGGIVVPEGAVAEITATGKHLRRK